MSDRRNPELPDEPRTSYDAGGDVSARWRGPVSRRGDEVDEQERQRVSQTDATAGHASGGVEGEGAVLRAGQPGAPAGAVGAHGDRYEMSAPVAPSRHSGDPGGTVTEEPPEEVYPAAFQAPHRRTDVDPRAAKRAERIVASLFLLSVVGVVLVWIAVIRWQPNQDGLAALRSQNVLIGLGLTIALGCIGAAAVHWARSLMSSQEYVQKRHAFTSSDADIRATLADIEAGVEASQFGRRSLIKRSMLLALGVLPLAALPLLRDLGPLPGKKLRTTQWRRGTRLVDEGTGQPIKLGDLRIGGIATVLPEGSESLTEEAKSATLLIRVRPGVLHGRTNLDWTVEGHVAYSKICTHAGCPISLYEQQTQHLFCPCHQSTFDIANGANVIFGPAARPLPQLPIAVDDQGYLVATSDYTQPVGPSFWERG